MENTELTWDTLPAYMIEAGDVIQLPDTDIYKRAYRVEDAEPRYVEECGRTWCRRTIRVNYNATPNSGLSGTALLDHETPMRVGKPA